MAEELAFPKPQRAIEVNRSYLLFFPHLAMISSTICFWVATAASSGFSPIILSPIKNVAVITLRRFHVFSDFPELAFAQLKNCPILPRSLSGSRVAGK